MEENPFAQALTELVGDTQAALQRQRVRTQNAKPTPTTASDTGSLLPSSIVAALGVSVSLETDLAVVQKALSDRGHSQAVAVAVRYGCVVVSCPPAATLALRVDTDMILQACATAGVVIDALRITAPRL